MRLGFLFALAAVSLACLGAFAEPKDVAEFTLESPTIADGGAIPWKHAMKRVKGGENLSPRLDWRNPPADTKSYAIVCIDAHPSAGRWVHWAVFNIPASCKGLKEGASRSAMPSGSVELNNSFGSSGWGGPQPPPGSGAHKYVFTVYALNAPSVAVEKKFMLEKDILQAMQGKVAGKAGFSGTFER